MLESNSNTLNSLEVLTFKSNISSLTITSWNIESLHEGKTKTPKTSITDFTDVFSDSNIVCMQETIKPVALSGFRAFNNIRGGCRVNHGGLCILVKNNIINGITHMTDITDSSEVIIIKCCKVYFKIPNDLYIINTYVSPKHSSWIKRTKYDGYAVLDTILLELNKRGSHDIVLSGDFNTRISTDQDFLRSDNLDKFIVMPPEVQADSTHHNGVRNSKDRCTNGYKKDLLDLLLSHQLTVLNGRTLGDVYGELTCYKWNGASTVDYCIVSSRLVDKVEWFSVKSFTPFSDHSPIQAKIKLPTRITATIPNKEDLCSIRCPKRFIMSDDGKRRFLELQNNDSFRSSLNTVLNHDDQNPVTFNKSLTSLIVKTADRCFNSTKPWKQKKKKAGICKPWFDDLCGDSKKQLKTALVNMEKYHSCTFHRNKYYRCKKSYFKLLRKKKRDFFVDLNDKIEAGKVLDWKAFKKLRICSDSTDSNFDDHTVAKFTSFFAKLYSDQSVPIPQGKQDHLKHEALRLSKILTDEHEQLLNNVITIEEVNIAISSLKSGKSSSDDIISNEILKCLTAESRCGLLQLFNKCLSDGAYPWNNSLITPLHKKGDKANPDNYRAIAVGSCIGKLFSAILLERIISFKTRFAPDPPNQMGFTKNAQTIDHILTIKTIVDKYKKKSQKVYCVFVDLRKAFDSVPRSALLYKLAKMGIRGNLFSVIRNMYEKSTCQLRLNNHLSRMIDIGKGTEQGHTLSPELFKSYMQDVTPLLNHGNVPLLGDTLLTHLLWADDLVLMALDLDTAQQLFTTFVNYCKEWGLEVNESKTNMVIFNKKSLKENHEFVFMGNSPIETVESYTYLGLTLHMSGSMSPAVHSLRTKAIRAMYALRRYIDRENLSLKSLLNLFDALIKPILTYGASIWAPLQPVSAALRDTLMDRDVPNKLIDKIGRDPSESVQLKYLKWALGVHKYASNLGCWGESGRLPIINFGIQQALKYLKRLEGLPDNLFVKKALGDQITHNLTWYSSISTIRRNLEDNVDSRNKQPLKVLKTSFKVSGIPSFRSRQN